MPSTPSPSHRLKPGALTPDVDVPDVPGDLLQLVLSTTTVETYLDELVHLVEDVSPVIAGVGVTLRRDHEVLSVSVSNAFAGSVDEVQYKLE